MICQDLHKRLDQLSDTIVTPPPFEDTEEYQKLAGEIDGIRQEEAVLKVSAEKKLEPLLEQERPSVASWKN